MKRCSLMIFLIAVLCISAFSQTYKGRARLIGHVYDEQGNPIEGVRVKLYSLKAEDGFTVETDSEGKWVASWIRGGGWNIDFEKVGYAPKQISVKVHSFKRNPEIDISLKKIEGLVLSEKLEEQLDKGNALFSEEKYNEAIATYKKILEEYPDAYVIHKNIGNCYFRMEDYDRAEEHYKKILEFDENNSDAFRLIGNCYANRGENEKALEWYNKIEFSELEDPIVLYNIGTEYYNLAQYQEALKYYKKSVEVQSDFLDGLYQLGLAHLTLGNNEDSIAAFEKYLELDPDSERAEKVEGFLNYLKR